MPNMRAIKTRIRSVTSTQQITKAMKMVAASKLRKVQSLVQVMRPFKQANREIMNSLACSGSGESNIYIKARDEIKKVCYVLMLGNKGLCGMYNTSVLNFMESIVAEETLDCEVIVCGKWGRDVIRKSGLPVSMYIDEFSDTPTDSEAYNLAGILKERYTNGEVDKIYLVYQSFVSALSQKPVCELLIPAENEHNEDDTNLREFIYIPDEKSVLDEVVELYINNQIYSAMLEARCSEHSARMTAMTAATDSTNELLAELDLSLNRARQAAITTEISEIVGGAAALKRNEE